MKHLALSLPSYGNIDAPGNVPTGGFIAGDVTVNSTISWALQVAFALAILLVLIMIVWGGVQWMTSGGDKEKVANARKRIVYSIFGLVIIFLSVLLLNILYSFLGTPDLGVPYSSTCLPGRPC